MTYLMGTMRSVASRSRMGFPYVHAPNNTCLNTLNRNSFTLNVRNFSKWHSSNTYVSNSFNRRCSIVEANMWARLCRADLWSTSVIIPHTHFSNGPPQRRHSTEFERRQERMGYLQRSAVLYMLSVIITMLGLSYLAVPLYKIFCQQYGLGGLGTELEMTGHKTEAVPTMKPIRDRPITVTFSGDADPRMKWTFKPLQDAVTVIPGETALVFFKANNPTDRAITGIATYNILPYQAAQYFNKIQCFCFEEQRLNPHEEVDMPVFFYIDPEYDLDADLLNQDSILLGYHFFEAEPGTEIPLPGFMQQHHLAKPPLNMQTTAS